MSLQKRRVTYFYDNDIGSFSYGPNHPMKPFRMRMTNHLISAYGMLDKMHVLRPHRATPLQLAAFHTDEYVNFLTKVSPETADELTGNGQRYLLGELDNPAFEGLFEFCTLYAGGSLDAAERINSGSTDIAINWAGGLHHAKKREASGFCYVNDIVLCILELLRSYQRVVYIDIDCHHGDGVEEAFYSSDRVLTVSFHKYGEYFPGTGAIADKGRGPGKGYSVNVPFRDGITDDSFRDIFESVMGRVNEWYRPGAYVLQCGADSLAGDKLGCLNISMEGHANCVEFVRKMDVPFVLLGGGGYTVKNVARAWAYETACAVGIQHEIDRDLPFNEYFEWFGPRYRLEVPASNMEDLNTIDGYLQQIKTEIAEQLKSLPFAPSVQMQEVPRQTLARAAGIDTGTAPRDDLESSRDIDSQLAQYVDKAKQRRDRKLELHAERAVQRGESPLASFEDNHHTASRGHFQTNGFGRTISLLPRPTSLLELINAKTPSRLSKDAPRRFFAGGATVPVRDEEEEEDGLSEEDEGQEDVEMHDEENEEDERRRRDILQQHAPPIWDPSHGYGGGIVAAAA